MANEYADLAAFRSSLNMADDDTSADDLLNAALGAAARGIDTACGRRFYLDADATARTYVPAARLTPEEGGGWRLLVDDIGAADITVETGSSGSWTAVDDVETRPDNALAAGRPITALWAPYWPCGLGQRVRVTARWGWPAVPEEVEQAALIQAARLYKRKDSPEGVTGSAEWGVVRLSRRDPDVWALIEHFVLPGFG
ncbi:phage gp6-like head-tail connector protein [Streptomyces sp. WMMC897]|uniref:phage gp6-like head-tail connector protein n=1 Tax=Streptomyces sp. WMMC897 TaxID=3014782 RepID=UPI0022B5E8E4|nr:phage gp6-like head-tail connector protein [Streptomyces sp. WMMC897]MCZ7413042.1 phage gp6-like head-tail connector protein [Streptomyces sp. WMMC897]MCZ7413076.1 phage gp6-like head-tail connector protein [Streptomyces sp. WMMC897]MCZ7415452.1 phage gp6-like head-tail connector protein [Streptomyces sp. WMMC897]